TRKPVVINLKENEIFQVMKATCALPFFYNEKVFINGKRCIDGSLSINKIFDSIISQLEADGFTEIIVIVNRKNLIKSTSPIIKILEPSKMPLFSQFDTNKKRIIKTIEQGFSDTRFFFSNNKI
ncbi:MAG TPA: hypothetical protein VMV71_02380, partial [Candidatus Paceibacterota bacterium]|nr:hypothetical protein [Candidatus Paceibacterota bacterium]